MSRHEPLARFGGGGIVSRMGKRFFWAKISVCDNCPCIENYNTWDVGVASKGVGEVVVY